VFFELGGDGFGRMIISAEIFDGLEPTCGSGRKPLEKAHFLKDEAQIGGELGHRAILSGSGSLLFLP
jgi:hypothetical protein